jgi:hypothetical protein
MPRLPIVILAVAVVAGIAQQLVIPPVAEDVVVDRLERYGGEVRVTLSAFPAVRLLADDGESIEIAGTGLELDLDEEPVDAFERLDGFDQVRLALQDLEAGPLMIDSFELRRGEDDETYSLEIEGETSPRAIAGYVGGQAAGRLGSVLGDAFAGAVLPDPGVVLPLSLDATIRSEDGRAHAEGATGSVSGVPAAPLAEIVADAVVRRL